MYIRELNVAEFEEFANNHQYKNHRQTINYAHLKSEHGYEYELIGYCDDNKIHAAALVLVKQVEKHLYAYVPEGFLIDYTDAKLLSEFTKAIYKRYKKEGVCSIKINPPIVIATIDPITHEKTYNHNQKTVSTLKICGFTQQTDNNNFESVLPKVNAIVDLDKYDVNHLSKNTKNKIRKGKRKGLTIELGNSYNLNIIHEFVKKKINKSEFYYNDYYNIFNRNGSVDYFLVSIDYEKYILNSQQAYEKELDRNEKLIAKVASLPGTKNINKKLNSDKTLSSYKNDIYLAAQNLNTEGNKKYIAGAIVIKHIDTITILISGYDKSFSEFVPNYFLYNEILEYYKGKYKYADLNGITGDFDKENKYYGLNRFKLGFNPNLYEYIGEFDLEINKLPYNQSIGIKNLFSNILSKLKK